MTQSTQPRQFELVSATGDSAASEQPISPAERYDRIVSDLYNEAVKNESLSDLVDVLTWALANAIVNRADPAVFGWVLGKLGGHTRYIADERAARREAEQARKEGHAFN